MEKIFRDRVLWLLIVLACIYIFGNIGTGSLTTWDEAVYANISQNVIDTGNWLVLHQGPSPWFDKPPLYIWCTAAFYKILGVSEFSTRVTSSLFGLATIIAVYIFVKRAFDKDTAVLASLLLLASPHYLHYSKMGMMDVTLTFFITSMVVLFWLGQDRPICLFWSGIAFIFAYFTKGFAAVAGPVVILLYCILSGNSKLLIKREFVIGFLISIAGIFVWHLVQYMLEGPKAIDNYFGFHIFARATRSLEGHAGGLNFYQKVIFNKNKPWGVIFYASLAYLFWLIIKDKDRRAIFVVSWAAAVFTICTIVRTKLHWYIMPVYPALAISSAIFLGKVFKDRMFKAVIMIILLGMLVQVPVSWAFKLDFNAKAKDAALHSIGLPYEDDGTIFYNMMVKTKNK